MTSVLPLIASALDRIDRELGSRFRGKRIEICRALFSGRREREREKRSRAAVREKREVKTQRLETLEKNLGTRLAFRVCIYTIYEFLFIY